LAGLLFENHIVLLNEGDSATQSEKAVSDRVKLAREIAARTKPRFIEIPRERQRPTYSEAQLREMRGGLSAEEYRRKFMRKRGKK
jgi:hypothetical protein